MTYATEFLIEKEELPILKTVCCPECRGALEMESSESLRCGSCDHMYRVQEGVPDLFIRKDPSIDDAKHPFRRFLVSPKHIERMAKKVKADVLDLATLVNPRQSLPIRFRGVATAIRLSFWLAWVIAIYAAPFRTMLGGVAFAGFVLDFIWLKFALHQQYRRELAQLLECAREGAFHEKDVKDPLEKADQPDAEEIAEDRSVVIGNALSGVALQDKTVLHVGCGGEHDADLPQVYVERGARLLGLDVYRPAIAAFQQVFAAPAVLAEALGMPFRDDQFDVANCTDIIEHVHDPFKFLQENYRVLKPGGKMLLVTPNRFRIRRSYHVLNPIVLLLPLFERLSPALLFPREVIASRMLPKDVDPSGRVFVFFHTSFTRLELQKMLLAAGFQIEWVRVKAYRGHFRRLRSYLEHIPLLRDLNDSVFAVVTKPIRLEVS